MIHRDNNPELVRTRLILSTIGMLAIVGMFGLICLMADLMK